MELLRDGGTKICSNGPGHSTKMAAMPIYVKNLLRNQKADDLETFVCSIGCSNTTKFAQMMTLGWPWSILQQGQIGVNWMSI